MQCMWILNTNDAWKKNFGQKHRNQKFFSCDRSNINWVKQTQTKNFNRNFDWSKNRFDRLKVWKNQIFEKQSILMQKLLKAHCFIKKIAWVWDKKFFKNTWIQPRSSKIKIFNQFVLKAQTLNTFCIKIKELLILDGHNKITHNIMYQV